MKIKKGDKVRVLAGKDKGREGVVSRVISEKNRVIVDGINVVKKHQRATASKKNNTRMTQGGIIDREMPLDVSNVAVVSPADGKTTRVGFRIDDAGRKHRICKRTGSEL